MDILALDAGSVTAWIMALAVGAAAGIVAEVFHAATLAQPDLEPAPFDLHRVPPRHLALAAALGAGAGALLLFAALPLTLLLYAVFAVPAARVDQACRILPDRLILGLLWAGLILAAGGLSLIGLTAGRAILAVAVAFMGAALLARAATWLLPPPLAGAGPLTEGEEIIEPFGGGDVKLFAAIAAWTGLQGLFLAIAAGALLMLAGNRLLNRRQDQAADAHVPAGPWFVLSGACVLIAAASGWLPAWSYVL